LSPAPGGGGPAGRAPEQNLPIGAATGPHALRWRRRVPVLKPARPRGHWLLAAAGLLAAATGAAAALARPEVDVRASAASYRLGGAELRAVGGGGYEGAGAALVISDQPAEVRAAASTYLGGRHMVGRCVYVRGADHESCVFSLGAQRFSATDRRTPEGWERTYSDGGEVRLRSGGPAVPVPFPVGHFTWGLG
jgi:hypothetical protein